MSEEKKDARTIKAEIVMHDGRACIRFTTEDNAVVNFRLDTLKSNGYNDQKKTFCRVLDALKAYGDIATAAECLRAIAENRVELSDGCDRETVMKAEWEAVADIIEKHAAGKPAADIKWTIKGVTKNTKITAPDRIATIAMLERNNPAFVIICDKTKYTYELTADDRILGCSYIRDTAAEPWRPFKNYEMSYTDAVLKEESEEKVVKALKTIKETGVSICEYNIYKNKKRVGVNWYTLFACTASTATIKLETADGTFEKDLTWKAETVESITAEKERKAAERQAKKASKTEPGAVAESVEPVAETTPEPVAETTPEPVAESVEPVAVAENRAEKKADNLSWIDKIPMPSKEELAADMERRIMEGAERERERLRSEMTEEEKRNEIIYNILSHKYEFVKDENGKEHGVLKAENNDESKPENSEPVAVAESVEPVAETTPEPVAESTAESAESVATYSENDITVFDCGGEFELKAAARKAIKKMLSTGTASLKTGGVKYEIRYLHPSWRDYGRHYQLKAGGELESGFMLVNFDAVFPASAFNDMGKLTGPASEINNDDFILQPLKPVYKSFFEPMEGAEVVEVESFEPVETIADEYQAEPVAVAETTPEPVAESVEPVAEIISYGTPARIISGELTTAEKRAVARIMTEKICTVEDAENSYHLGYNNTLKITSKASGETAEKNFTIKIETGKPVAETTPEPVAESVEPVAETTPEPVAESVEPVAETTPENVEQVATVATVADNQPAENATPEPAPDNPEPVAETTPENVEQVATVAPVADNQPAENATPEPAPDNPEPVAETVELPAMPLKVRMYFVGMKAGCLVAFIKLDKKDFSQLSYNRECLDIFYSALREADPSKRYRRLTDPEQIADVLRGMEKEGGVKFVDDFNAGYVIRIYQRINTAENTETLELYKWKWNSNLLTLITKTRTRGTSEWSNETIEQFDTTKPPKTESPSLSVAA